MGIPGNGTLISEASYLKIWVNREENVLVYKWLGYLQDTDAKKGMNLITANISRHSFTCMLGDLSEFKGSSVTTARWVNEVWSEKLKEAGLEKVAVYLPQGPFGDFSNKLATGEKTLSLLQVKQFTTYEGAYNWFKEGC